MVIYVDAVFILNFIFDFILLLGVSIILKRRVRLYRIILGGLVGSMSTLLLFTTISNIKLFMFKVLISILMCITSFTYKNIKYTIKNILYLYIISIFLGGTLYLINNQLAEKQMGLLFIYNGLSINIILVVILTPLIIGLYIRQCKKIKCSYNNYYKVDIYVKDKVIHTTSLLDTGNKLFDPYTLRPVLLLSSESKIFNNIPYVLIPYHTITNNGFIKGYKVDKIYIEGVGYKKKIIVGLINSLNMEGVESIISLNILEGI